MKVWSRLLEFLDRDGRAVLVTIREARGSTPREAGARMVVRADGDFSGTIGGGTLEWLALAEAQKLMVSSDVSRTLDRALGPDLGQCCGGHARLSFERFEAADRAWIASLARSEARGGLFKTVARVDARGVLVRALADEQVSRRNPSWGGNGGEPHPSDAGADAPSSGRLAATVSHEGRREGRPSLQVGPPLPSPLVGEGSGVRGVGPTEVGENAPSSGRFAAAFSHEGKTEEAPRSSRVIASGVELPPLSARGRRVGGEGGAAAVVGILESFGSDATPLILFGAGHVGRALVLALAPLPFAITWVDTRADAFPAHVPGNVDCVAPADPISALAPAGAGTLVAVMTHSHALDLAIVAASLPDPRFPYVGLIGSATKRARFSRQMRDAGLPVETVGRLVCPIGLPGIAGKEPAVIAAGIVAQMLVERTRMSAVAPAGMRAAE